MNAPLVTDSVTSMVAELGTARDKAASVSYNVVNYNDTELVNAYRSSWLARKIVDIPAQDSAREWRAWQAEEDQVEAIEEEERRLGLQAKVLRASTLGRLYGAAYLYFDLGDDPSQPVRVERLKKGALRFVTVLTYQQLTVGEIDQDPLSAFYGQPAWYEASSPKRGTQRVHPSRVVRFGGNPKPEQELINGDRDDSVLVALLDAIKQFDSTAANIASLVFEAKIDVISVNGLMTIAGNPYESRKLLERYRLAATAKGNNGMLLLDAENETYEQKSFAFSALSDIMDRYAQNSAGAADIPMTRLFGRSPGGMNSTGDSDLRNYYDRIQADQNLRLRPALSLLDECLIRSALGTRPEEVHYLWNSLWQMTDKERSDLGTATVAMVKNLKETGLFPDEVLAASTVTKLTQDGALPGLESEYKTYFEEGGEWDLGQEEPPEEPPEGNPPPGNGGNQFQDDFSSQPRAPKGSPNGGQWVKQGGGGGGAADKAAASVATSKYPADKVKALLDKDKKDLSHYEKKVLSKYKAALKEEQALANISFGEKKPEKSHAVEAAESLTDYEASQILKLGNHSKIDPEALPVLKKKAANYEAAIDSDFEPLDTPAPKTTPEPGSKAAALASVATPAYPAEKIEALLAKDKSELTHYEKKKLAAYKKALQGGGDGAPKTHALTPDTLAAIKAASGAPNSMQAETVAKLASGEWKPDATKPWQGKIVSAAEEYKKTGKLPTAGVTSSTGAYGKGLTASLLGDPPPITNPNTPQTQWAQVKALTPAESAAAQSYTGSTYRAINGALRKGSTHHLVPSIDAAIAKTAATQKMVVVRGVSSDGMSNWLAASGGKLKVGAVIKDKGFVSTTRVASVASSFAGGSTGFGLKINVPKGSKILPLKSISKYAQEDEFLLPRGSAFKITAYNEKSKVITVDLIKN